ncbi:MAG: TRL domain-containing protein [Sumerlaeia bacterium]
MGKVARFFTFLVALTGIACLSSGCGSAFTSRAVYGGSSPFAQFQEHAPVVPPPGFLFQETKAPLVYNVNETQVAGLRSASGQARFLNVPFTYGLLSFTWQPVDVKTIAEDGGISEVSYADYSVFNVLGVYREMTINVYGR